MDEAQEKKLLSFLETATFVERLAELGGDQQMELLYEIQDELLADPERGDLVKGLGGVRKARIAAPTRPEGKRGGSLSLPLLGDAGADLPAVPLR